MTVAGVADVFSVMIGTVHPLSLILSYSLTLPPPGIWDREREHTWRARWGPWMRVCGSSSSWLRRECCSGGRSRYTAEVTTAVERVVLTEGSHQGFLLKSFMLFLLWEHYNFSHVFQCCSNCAEFDLHKIYTRVTKGSIYSLKQPIYFNLIR